MTLKEMAKFLNGTLLDGYCSDIVLDEYTIELFGDDIVEKIEPAMINGHPAFRVYFK